MKPQERELCRFVIWRVVNAGLLKTSSDPSALEIITSETWALLWFTKHFLYSYSQKPSRSSRIVQGHHWPFAPLSVCCATILALCYGPVPSGPGQPCWLWSQPASLQSPPSFIIYTVCGNVFWVNFCSSFHLHLSFFLSELSCRTGNKSVFPFITPSSVSVIDLHM